MLQSLKSLKSRPFTGIAPSGTGSEGLSTASVAPEGAALFAAIFGAYVVALVSNPQRSDTFLDIFRILILAIVRLGSELWTSLRTLALLRVRGRAVPHEDPWKL